MKSAIVRTDIGYVVLTATGQRLTDDKEEATRMTPYQALKLSCDRRYRDFYAQVLEVPMEISSEY